MLLLTVLACIATDPPPTPTVRTYTVVRGDSLSLIARREGVTVEELKRWNGLGSDLIEVDQVLRIEDGGEPPEPALPRRTGARTTKRTPSPVPEMGTADGPTLPALSRPTPRACLSVDTVGGSGEMVSSQGLDPASTTEVMNAFMPKLGSCLVGLDPWPTTALPLQIHVGCDGLVDHVGIQGGHDWSVPHAECIQQALSFVAFPPHALPEGDSFLYPLRMQ